MAPWEATAIGLRVHLRVTPRAKRPGIDGSVSDPDGRKRLAVKVAQPPADGAANKAVTALLAKAAGVPKSRVTLIAGAASRLKTVEIAGDGQLIASALARTAGL